MARALMIQGTGSDVGKSLILAGLSRAFSRRGLKVFPFKPQNMSNNAAVTKEGGEIGRAQALQARACRVPPEADMNPVLLKPQGEGSAQVILGGRVWGTASAREYRALAPSFLPFVLAAFARLAARADLVLVEGAGSAAEINLRQGDIANMGFAEAADLPVVLVADIERGGVIAQVAGTAILLSPGERARVKGYIVNKFRGDPGLFEGGLAALERLTGLEAFGVVPYFEKARLLPAEDSLALTSFASRPRRQDAPILAAVPMLPRIANFDDLDPLAAESAIECVFVPPGRPLPRQAQLVVLPGSKATIADLDFLRQEGWDIDLLAHRRQGGTILGLCGGFQMLGQRIADPLGMEGPARSVPGLDLLEVDTVLGGEKLLGEVRGVDIATGTPVSGYGMHLGKTTGPGSERPMLRLSSGPDGACSADGRVMGTYLHGIFASDPFRHAFIERLGGEASGWSWEGEIETILDAFADHLEENLDLDGLFAASGSLSQSAKGR